MDSRQAVNPPSASEIIPPILWGVLILLAVLIAAAMLIMYLSRWAKRSAGTPLPSVDLLSQFRLLYERGECSQEEFERIRAKLGKQLKEELKSTAVPPARPVRDPASDQVRLPTDLVEPRIGPVTGPSDSDPSSQPAGDASD